MLYLGFGALLVLTVDLRARGWLGPVARLGEYSYSIYLWHMVFVPVFPHAAVWLLPYLCVSIGWGVLMAKAVELPALAWRARITEVRCVA